MTAAALHYGPFGDPPKSACALADVPAERLTVDLDAVTCGNCLPSIRWRGDMSQRLYQADYERFYGPGGFLDRAGQTIPASATTAPQAWSAMERAAREELEHVAGLARKGAGTDVIAVAVRSSAESLMRSVDALLRTALIEATGPEARRD